MLVMVKILQLNENHNEDPAGSFTYRVKLILYPR
jgi:hypothetical protein